MNFQCIFKFTENKINYWNIEIKYVSNHKTSLIKSYVTSHSRDRFKIVVDPDEHGGVNVDLDETWIVVKRYYLRPTVHHKLVHFPPLGS